MYSYYKLSLALAAALPLIAVAWFAHPSSGIAEDELWQWAQVEGRSRNDGEGTGVAFKPDGGVCTTGTYSGSPRFGSETKLKEATESLFYVACYTADGVLEWVRSYGDEGNVAASGIAIGPDGAVYLSGSIYRAVLTGEPGRWSGPWGSVSSRERLPFVARLTPSGAVGWVHALEQLEGLEATAVAVGPGGGIFVTGGYSSASALFGISPPDRSAFVARLTERGAVVWVRQADVTDATEGAIGNAIAVTDSGSVYVGGYVYAPQGERGGHLAFGTERTGFASRASGFIARFDSTGESSWIRALHTEEDGESSIEGASTDAASNLYVTGAFSRQLNSGGRQFVSTPDTFWPEGHDNRYQHTDPFVAKFDSSGNAIWTRVGGGGPYSDFGMSIATRADGQSAVIGSFMGRMSFGALAVNSEEPIEPGGFNKRCMFTAIIDADGNMLRVAQNVPEVSSGGRGVTMSETGRVAVTGTVGGSVQFGRLHIEAEMGKNMFVAVLDL